MGPSSQSSKWRTVYQAEIPIWNSSFYIVRFSCAGHNEFAPDQASPSKIASSSSSFLRPLIIRACYVFSFPERVDCHKDCARELNLYTKSHMASLAHDRTLFCAEALASCFLFCCCCSCRPTSMRQGT